MHLQDLIDGMSARWMRERAETQLTLGALIEALEKLPPDKLVANLHSPHSYRGYYSDLAFELEGELRKAEEILADCRGAMGRVFKGYKGGDYVMGARTPLWVANYGCTGMKLMALREDGSIETAEDSD